MTTGCSLDWKTGTFKAALCSTALFCLGVFFAADGAAQNVQQDGGRLFDQANVLYREGKHLEAANLYRQLAQESPENPAFAFNLGNALIRLNRLGEAILAYEKAKLAAPRNEDIRRNLQYARGLVGYRVDDKRNWYLQAAEQGLE